MDSLKLTLEVFFKGVDLTEQSMGQKFKVKAKFRHSKERFYIFCSLMQEANDRIEEFAALHFHKQKKSAKSSRSVVPRSPPHVMTRRRSKMLEEQSFQQESTLTTLCEESVEEVNETFVVHKPSNDPKPNETFDIADMNNNEPAEKPSKRTKQCHNAVLPLTSSTTHLGAIPKKLTDITNVNEPQDDIGIVFKVPPRPVPALKAIKQRKISKKVLTFDDLKTDDETDTECQSNRKFEDYPAWSMLDKRKPMILQQQLVDVNGEFNILYKLNL